MGFIACESSTGEIQPPYFTYRNSDAIPRSYVAASSGFLITWASYIPQMKDHAGGVSIFFRFEYVAPGIRAA